MAESTSKLITNKDVADYLDQEVISNENVKMVFLSVAFCDFNGKIGNIDSDKYAQRLSSRQRNQMDLIPDERKIISNIRKTRKDIFLVGFKTTTNASPDSQYQAGLKLCKESSCNLVLANDTVTRLNMIVTPEESRYCETPNRDEVLSELVAMSIARSKCRFTRSTVVPGRLVNWNSDNIPNSLRTVVNYCINRGAYQPFNNATAGHFATKVNDSTFLTSIRKSNFNKLEQVGLVRVESNGPDTVIAYGAKPSVGGQSQRIIFRDHPEYDCIVHAHITKKENSKVPDAPQKWYECGSHECGESTSRNLKKFGNLSAVNLQNHGPNIVFNSRVNPQEIINFLEENFEIDKKTGGDFNTILNGN